MVVPVTAARWAKWLRVVASAPATCAGSASEAVAKSRIRAACSARAASVLPEISHGTTGSVPAAGSFRSASCRAGTASRITWALVPLMPNEDTAARRGRSSWGQVTGSVSSRTAPVCQSTCGLGSSTCRVRGQHAVAHRQHHLDDAGDAGGGLGVADVGLHRAQPQRPLRRAVLAVGGEQRLGLDRVAEGGAGAVGLDGVDVGRGAARRRPAPGWMTRCWEGPFGAVRPLLAPSWLTAEPRTTASTGWPLRSRVRQPLQQQHADALGPAGAVGGGGERLAAAVGGQPALAAELDEGGRGGHHRHAAGQREVALAAAQRLRGQVQGDQRRGAGRVDGDRRALQAEGVGDPAGGDAAGAAGAPGSPRSSSGASPTAGRRSRCTSRRRTRRSRLPRSGGRVDAGAFEGLPGRLQQQPLLRVRGQRLARGDAEELGVEVAGVVQEAALAGVASCRGGRGRGRRGPRGPSRGRRGSRRSRPRRRRPAATGPPGTRRRRGSGRPCRRSRSARRALGRACGTGGGSGVAVRRSSSASRCAASAVGRRVVEDEGGGQPQAGGGVEAVAQFDGGQRVEAQVPERPVGCDRLRVGVPEYRGRPGLRTRSSTQLRPARPRSEPAAGAARVRAGGARSGATGRGPARAVSSEQARRDGVSAAAGGASQVGRDGTASVARGRARASSSASPRSAAAAAPRRCSARSASPGRAAHAGSVPRAPGEGGGGQAVGVAVVGEGVQEGVGGGVVALSRRCRGCRRWRRRGRRRRGRGPG